MTATIKLTKTVCLSAAMGLTAFYVLCFGLLREAYADEEIDDGGVDVPIVMYHIVTDDEALAGEYVVTAEQLEKDIVFLLEQGFTPVFCSELADFVNEGGELPEKPVVITFDDGAYGCFYYALPLLEKYKVKATFSIVGEWSMAAGEDAEPNVNYSTVDIDNLKTMYLSGYCELANHTWDMHGLTSEGAERDGALQIDGESDAEYRRALWNNITQAQNFIEQAGQRPSVLAYPYGFASDYTQELVWQLGFEVTLGCEERINRIAKGDYDCLYNMGRFNRAYGETSEEFFLSILQ